MYLKEHNVYIFKTPIKNKPEFPGVARSVPRTKAFALAEGSSLQWVQFRHVDRVSGNDYRTADPGSCSERPDPMNQISPSDIQTPHHCSHVK